MAPAFLIVLSLARALSLALSSLLSIPQPPACAEPVAETPSRWKLKNKLTWQTTRGVAARPLMRRGIAGKATSNADDDDPAAKHARGSAHLLTVDEDEATALPALVRGETEGEAPPRLARREEEEEEESDEIDGGSMEFFFSIRVLMFSVSLFFFFSLSKESFRLFAPGEGASFSCSLFPMAFGGGFGSKQVRA